MALASGTRVRDYTIVRRLGRPGGQATAYLAKKATIGEKFVLKQLRGREYDRADAVKEAQMIVGAGHHDNVVRVFDAFEHAGQPYVVMEYIPGGTLEKRLKGLGRPMSKMHWWRILRPLLYGMNHIHSKPGDDDSRKIVHGDIKPANIILKDEDDARPVLVDFGGAGIVGRMRDRWVYTELYACPEARSGDGPHPYFDVFSVAVVSYEAMFGSIPTKVVKDQGRQRTEPDTARMRRRLERRHDGFLNAIARAMHPNPSERPESVLDWLAQMAFPFPVPQAETQANTAASIRKAIEADFGLSKEAVKICDTEGRPYNGNTKIDTVVREHGQDWRLEDGVVIEDLETRQLKTWIESRYKLPQDSIRFYRPNGNEYGKGSGLANRTRLKTLLNLWRDR